ncbi:MAG: parvulin-like peptidyl-prolyl isomerase [Acidimicrobiaceae bacterium]|nr:parvulin-like peptidyl-prolyl isomerase [Acidimicrobiaceae bacterium]
MRKLLLPVAALVALSVLLGACSAQLTPSAARAAGSTITSSTLTDAMRSIADDKGYRCEVLASATANGGQLAIEGKGGSGYAASFAADVLSELVQYAVVHADVVRLGLGEGSFARQLVATHLDTQYAPSSTSGCATTGAQVLAGFSSSYRNRLIAAQLDEFTLLGHLAGIPLTSQGVSAYEATHKSVSTLDCTSVIQVASKAAALAASKQIAAGVSFASVAKSESTDSSATSGGSLGCILPSDFASPLNGIIAGLTVGQVSAPVQFGTSYLLLVVTSRPLASLLQIAYQLVLAQQTTYSSLLPKLIAGAHVTVDPTYGSWKHSSAGWSVAPPTGPANALVPDPVAITPAAASASPS